MSPERNVSERRQGCALIAYTWGARWPHCPSESWAISVPTLRAAREELGKVAVL